MILTAVLVGGKITLLLSAAFHGSVMSQDSAHAAGCAAAAGGAVIIARQAEIQPSPVTELNSADKAMEFADHGTAWRLDTLAGAPCTFLDPQTAAPRTTPITLSA